MLEKNGFKVAGFCGLRDYKGSRVKPLLKSGGSAPGQDRPSDSTTAPMSLYPPAEIAWKDGPASLPAGARIAVLEGDPSKDGFFTMRLRLPDGFRIPPHWHPKVEHVTVISGTFNVGMGEKFDQSATRAMPAGTFGFWPADMRHFAWAKEETVVQLHGTGPWMITYVNSSDDPRKR